jgi:hypothetical protein
MHRPLKPLRTSFAALFLFVTILFAQQPPTDQPKDYSFTVPAAKPWTDTGLDLARGQIVHVYGSVVSCGAVTPVEKHSLPLPSAPAGVLLAKVHLDAPPVNATPDAELPIIDPSHLYLGVNGSNCAGGTIPAKVHVEPAPPPKR